MAENRLLAEHRRRNAASQDAWQRFAAHRRQVTDLLLNAASPDAGGRLCVLGAGNCCDLDLAALLARFCEVHLVDLDRAALAGGVHRQQLDTDPRVIRHVIDVTGVADRLGTMSPETPADDPLLAGCLRDAAAPALPSLPAPFDVAASVCLLTQLIDSVVLTLGVGHPRFLEMLMTVRNAHLRQLLELAQPGGAAVLVSDVVSSETCATLAETPPDELPGRLAALINAHNFFTGANPFALRAFWENDPHASRAIERIELTNPWLWDLGPRVYAVCALVARRRTVE